MTAFILINSMFKSVVRWEVLFPGPYVMALWLRDKIFPTSHLSMARKTVVNFHLMPFDVDSELIGFSSRVSHTVWLRSWRPLISLLSVLKVFALSYQTAVQTPLRLITLSNVWRNSSVVRLFVSSRWTIWDDAHVNIQTYAFVMPELSFTYMVRQNLYQCA